MNLLLKAKHWQLFIIFFVIPLVSYIIVMVSMMQNAFAAAKQGLSDDPFASYGSFGYCSIIVLAIMVVYFAWFWSVNVKLGEKIPQDLKPNILRFKLLFFIQVVYFIFTSVAFLFVDDFMLTLASGNEEALESFVIAIMIIMPIHLFSIFCIFYMFYFTAKTLKTIELKRETSFSDFFAEFFMVWFLPVGIWLLQPKINEIVATKEGDEDNDVVPPPIPF